MEQTLFENGIVITVDDNNTLYRKGYVLVEGRQITAVGEGSYPGERAGLTVIDAAGKAILPGIVNAHTHVAGSLFKGLLEDDPNGFYGFALPMEGQLTPDDVYHLSLLGAWECMQGGVTTINEIYHYVLSVAKAVDEIGLRAVISQNIVDVDIGALRHNDYTRHPKMGDAFLEENIRLLETYHGKDNGRITCRVGPHATDTVSFALAQKCAALGEKYGVGFHTHVAQSEREVALVRESYGLTPVEFMKETGLLGKNLMAAHCIYTTDSDIKLLAESGTYMAHCTEGLGRHSDFPPTKKMFAAEVHLVLGTDWLTMDPWTNMRFGVALNRQHGVDFETACALSMLRRSTIEPARALGLGAVTGSLEVGKQADLILMDLSGPNLTPLFHDPVVTLVYNANRYDVCDVMIAGRFTVRERKLQTMSETEIVANGQKTAMQVYERHTGTRF